MKKILRWLFPGVYKDGYHKGWERALVMGMRMGGQLAEGNCVIMGVNVQEQIDEILRGKI